jgi:hypothetical protein
VNDNVVADQADACAALDLAFGDTATGNLADLGDVEHLEDLGIAEEGLAPFRRQQARHRRFHVIHQIVDDVVVADLDTVTLGRVARLLVGTHVEADDRSARCLGRLISDSVMAPAPEWMIRALTSSVPSFSMAPGNGFDRALHVALDQERKLLAAGVLQLGHHLLERTACRSGAQPPCRGQAGAGDIRRSHGRGLHSRPQQSGRRPAACPEGREFQPESGSGFVDLLAAVIDQRAHTAPLHRRQRGCRPA